MKTKAKAVIIIFWLLFCLGLHLFPVVMVMADGAISPQETTAYFTMNDIEPENSTGTYDDGYDDNENAYRMSYIPFHGTNPEYWTYNITQIRTRGYSGSGYASLCHVVFYKVNNESDASDLWGYDTLASGSPPSGWTVWGVYPEVEVDYGEHGVYVAWKIGGISGLHGIWYEYRTQNYGALSAGSVPTPPDPLTGETNNSAKVYAYTIDYKAWNVSSTTHNQYYGDSENYTARRDVNYTFPSGASNKEIKITLPNDEYLLNITRSNGGLWNKKLLESDYSIESYNSTHKVVTIGNTPIILYGSEYRLYSSSHPYCYTLNGLFIENGTKYGNVNITVYQPSGTNDYMVDGKKVIGFDEKPIQIVWELSGGGIRKFYMDENSEEFYLFTPDDTYSTYSFTIKDHSASIGSGDTFLEALRVVNGTEKLIERVLIQDTSNAVPLTLVKNKVYVLQARLYDDTIHRFGYFIPESDPTPTLSISGVAMSDQAHYVGEHLAVEAVRSSATHIQINYEDDLDMTLEFFYEICFMNLTSIVNDTVVGNPLQIDWYGAVNTTDYLVNVRILHYFYDEVTYSAALVGVSEDIDEAPDWSIFGAGAKDAFSVFVIIGTVFLFSKATALIGVFMGVVVTYLLLAVNMTTIPYNVAHACMALTIMWGLWEGTR